MIRLIASDLDGTLLDDEKRLPDDFFEVLDGLSERGIIFAVASGRTYSAVEHLFPEEYRNKISYICDNGACAYINGSDGRKNTDEIFPLDRGLYEELLEKCGQIGGFELVVCASSGVYHVNNESEFAKDVGLYYKQHTAVDDLLNIEGEIYKLAICDKLGTVTHGKPIIDGIFGERLNVQASGVEWMDVMAGGVSKGRALRALQERLGILPSETMAFGDYFNDVDMLAAAEWSFCMENGSEEVKKLCRFIAPAGGVTKCIKKFVFSEQR
ncbi:MAG: HAD family hydrolase [Oscillospiraceae bacterium]|nr:HAD family hydrolase [Oscillospiraceae bacterium]